MSRLKSFLYAALAVGGSVGSFYLTLPSPERVAVRADMERLGINNPGLVPAILDICPDCALTPSAYKVGEYVRANGRVVDNICKKQGNTWVFCGVDTTGNGVGCDQSCPVEPATGTPYPTTGEGLRWLRYMQGAPTDEATSKFIKKYLNGGGDVSF